MKNTDIALNILEIVAEMIEVRAKLSTETFIYSVKFTQKLLDLNRQILDADSANKVLNLNTKIQKEFTDEQN